MSVTTSLNRNDYVGNNTTATYAYGFKIFSASDLRVTVNSAGVETPLVLNTNYTVTGVGSKNGGTIILSAGNLANAVDLTIRRVRPITQTTDIRNSGDSYPETIEDQFDKMTMVDQQQQDEISRSITLPETVSASAFNPALPSDILSAGGRVLAFNPAGDGFADASTWPTITDIGGASTASTQAVAAAAAAAVSEAVAVASALTATTAIAGVEASEAAAIQSAIEAAASAVAASGSYGLTLDQVIIAQTAGNAAASSATNAATSEVNAAASALAASLSETASAGSASAALSSSSAAAASASQAAVASAASLWADVTYVTFAGSPLTVTDAHAGTLFAIDCSGGNVVVNLPTISTLSLAGPWAVGFKKTDSGANTITLNRGGTDTVGGATSKVIARAFSGTTLIPDTDGSPDQWTPISFGEIPITGAIVGTTDAQVLTNKDYDGGTASNTSRITLPKAAKATLDGLTRKEGTIVYATDTAKAFIDNGTSLVAVGSGSGGGGIDYITNGSAESDAVGWATYLDAAGTSPVDGTGGTALSTFLRQTSSPLASTASFEWVKSANNRQGEGFSTPFTIDNGRQAQQLAINYLVQAVSGTYVAGDMTVWVYDVTNAKLIQPSAFQVQASTLGGPAQQLTFQAASNSTSYRLIFHTATVSALAYTLKFDNISVGPQVKSTGVPVTDETVLTPTIGAVTTPPTPGTTAFNRVTHWRVGKFLNYRFTFRQTAAGSSGTGTYLLPMPSGLTIDTTNMVIGSQTGGTHVGEGKFYNGSTVFDAEVNVYSATNLQLQIQNATSDYAAWGSASGGLGNTNIEVTFTAQVPITGWSSNVLVSDSASTRVVSMLSAGTPSASLVNGSFVAVKYPAALSDTHAGYNPSTGEYTIKVPGIYDIYATTNISGTFASSGAGYLGIKINASTSWYSYHEVSGGAGSLSCSTTVRGMPLKVGDVILPVLQSANWSTASIGSDSSMHSFSVCMQQGPAQIAASSTVACNAFLSSQTPAANTVTKVQLQSTTDTHGAFNNSTYDWTCPAPGIYEITADNSFGGFGAAISVFNYIYKNGSSLRQVFTTSESSGSFLSNNRIETLVVGDVISLYVNTGVGNANGISNVNMAIKRIGGIN